MGDQQTSRCNLILYTIYLELLFKLQPPHYLNIKERHVAQMVKTFKSRKWCSRSTGFYNVACPLIYRYFYFAPALLSPKVKIEVIRVVDENYEAKKFKAFDISLWTLPIVSTSQSTTSCKIPEASCYLIENVLKSRRTILTGKRLGKHSGKLGY